MEWKGNSAWKFFEYEMGWNEFSIANFYCWFHIEFNEPSFLATASDRLSFTEEKLCLSSPFAITTIRFINNGSEHGE